MKVVVPAPLVAFVRPFFTSPAPLWERAPFKTPRPPAGNGVACPELAEGVRGKNFGRRNTNESFPFSKGGRGILGN